MKQFREYFGDNVINFLDDKGEHIERLYTDQPGRVIFGIRKNNRILELSLLPEELSSDDAVEAQIDFEYVDDYIRYWTDPDMRENAYLRGNDTLDEGTLEFLRFSREVAKRIEHVKTHINGSDPQRKRLYAKMFSKVQNPNLVIH